jgi:hypothetical protein
MAAVGAVALVAGVGICCGGATFIGLRGSEGGGIDRKVMFGQLGGGPCSRVVILVMSGLPSGWFARMGRHLVIKQNKVSTVSVLSQFVPSISSDNSCCSTACVSHSGFGFRMAWSIISLTVVAYGG